MFDDFSVLKIHNVFDEDRNVFDEVHNVFHEDRNDFLKDRNVFDENFLRVRFILLRFHFGNHLLTESFVFLLFHLKKCFFQNLQSFFF